MRRGLIFMFAVLACTHPSDQSPQDSTVSLDDVQVELDVDFDGGRIPADNMLARLDMEQVSADASGIDGGRVTRLDVAVSLDVSADDDAFMDSGDMILDATVQADDMTVIDMSITQDAMVTLSIEECFPEQQNMNLAAVSVELASTADGAEGCNADLAEQLDGNVAELGFAGGAPEFIDGQEVTACLRFDFGRTCALDEHVGVLVSSGAVSQACNPDQAVSNPQCDVEGLCGERSGASVLLFAGAQPQSLRFLARVGNCGEGTALNSLAPITAFSGASNLEGVRYIYACRPSLNCGADAGDVTIDALFLIWR